MPEELPDFLSARQAMVAEQLERRGIRDVRVLTAFREVPREQFVPVHLRPRAHDDAALPIGYEQTLSQPFTTALMVEALAVLPTDRVLEVGVGSGYSAAVLARLASEVYAIERVAALAATARAALDRLGHHRLPIRVGDGTLGWPQAAPFNAILVSAGGPRIPDALVKELAEGGRLVMPIGERRGDQTLVRILRCEDGSLQEADLGPVRFVPLIGEDGWD